MTRHLLDIASYQGALKLADVERAGFTAINLKISHGLATAAAVIPVLARGASPATIARHIRATSVHPNIAAYVTEAKQRGMGIGTFHWLIGNHAGAVQADYAYARMVALGLDRDTAHTVDVEEQADTDAETPPTWATVHDYVTSMRQLLGRPVAVYTGDWWWTAAGRNWNGASVTPYVWSAPNAGYLAGYPGDASPHWAAGYGGWSALSVMQYAVGRLTFPDGTSGTIPVSKSAIRDPKVWTALTKGAAMAMDPRTHPRGAPPNFSMAGLPANPNPQRITDALWWLAQMLLRLEPLSANGGILAIKPGYHSYGSRLPDHGQGNTATDHSIRRAPDRTGPWWRDFASAHDWTFTRAHSGNYTEINLYCNRLRNAMRDPNDLRPDDVYAYFIGQIDSDKTVEGYNEYHDDEETGDESHLWHRHGSYRRNIVGDFWAMWKALTIDMGWTYAEWQQSIEEDGMPTPEDLWKADVITNPKQRGDAATNPETSAKFAVGDLWQLVYNLRDAVSAMRADQSLYQKALLAALANADDGAAVIAAVREEGAKLTAKATEEVARDAATAAAIAAAQTELHAITAMLEGTDGDPDLAPLLTRLNSLEGVITTSGRQAGEEAAETVLARLAAAQDAEAAALRNPR